MSEPTFHTILYEVREGYWGKSYVRDESQLHCSWFIIRGDGSRHFDTLDDRITKMFSRKKSIYRKVRE